MQAQGSTANAKEDTVVFLDGSVTVDSSQFGTNMTANGTGGYETPSSRAAITSPRELYVRWTGTLTSQVALLVHGNTAQTDWTYFIGVDGSGNLWFSQNGATIHTGPKVAAVDYSLSWSTRPNPDTTGASDAVISEILIYDHTGGSILELVQVTHAASTTNAAWVLSVGGWWNGAALTNLPTNAPTDTRIGRAFHPHVEAFQDWIAARAAHSSVVDEVGRVLSPIPSSSEIGDSGLFAGQHPVGHAAELAQRVRRRLWSALINEVYRDPHTWREPATPAQWFQLAPGSSVYTMPTTRLRWEPVPAEATHAWARVHVKSWVTSGGAVPVGIRCYAMNRPEQIEIDGQIPTFDSKFCGDTITVDHGVGGDGEWLELGLVALPKFEGDHPAWAGTVHLGLAFAIDPAGASANDAAARVEINAWHVRPTSKFVPPGLELP